MLGPSAIGSEKGIPISKTVDAISTLSNLGFELFNISSGDELSIYDGDVANSSYLLGTFSGTTFPGPFTSTHESGCLTFVFTSDEYNTASGWDAAIHCLPFQPCKIPTDLTVTLLSDTTAELSWSQLGDGLTSWEIEYGVGDFPLGSGTIISVDSNPFVLEDLIPGVAYSWYIRGVCGEESYTDWSAPSGFNTTIIGIDDWQNDFDLVRIYPNPTSGKTTIDLKNSTHANLTVRLINIPGKIVFNQAIPGSAERELLDFSHLNTGIYFIQLTDGKHYITQKLIIE